MELKKYITSNAILKEYKISNIILKYYKISNGFWKEYKISYGILNSYKYTINNQGQVIGTYTDWITPVFLNLIYFVLLG